MTFIICFANWSASPYHYSEKLSFKRYSTATQTTVENTAQSHFTPITLGYRGNGGD